MDSGPVFGTMVSEKPLANKIDKHRLSLSEKRAHYKRWRLSGLSKKSFCQREGLTLSSFYFWCRKFETKGGSKKVPQKLLQLEGKDAPGPSSEGAKKKPFVEIITPLGYRFRFSGHMVGDEAFNLVRRFCYEIENRVS